MDFSSISRGTAYTGLNVLTSIASLPVLQEGQTSNGFMIPAPIQERHTDNAFMLPISNIVQGVIDCFPTNKPSQKWMKRIANGSLIVMRLAYLYSSRSGSGIQKFQYAFGEICFAMARVFTQEIATDYNPIKPSVYSLSLQESDHCTSSLSTGTLSGLVEASKSNRYNESHGRIFSHLDSSVRYLQEALFATVRLTCHLAFSVLGLLASITHSGRQFLVENLTRSFIDFTGVGIGLTGMIYPKAGAWATTKQLRFVEKYFMETKASLKKYDETHAPREGRWVKHHFSEVYAYMRTLVNQA